MAGDWGFERGARRAMHPGLNLDTGDPCQLRRFKDMVLHNHLRKSRLLAFKDRDFLKRMFV